MVLQDVGTPTDSFNDDPYPSDNDAYSTSAPSGQLYDASVLPQPIPIIGPLLGFHTGIIRFKVESTLKFAEMRLQRRLSAEEAQALAGHLYWLEQRKSYFAAAGVGFGAYKWYTTWEQCRYPMYQPKNINPNKFLFIKGPMAQIARHTWRGFCYVFLTAEFGKLVGLVLNQPVAGHASANDPRLAQFTQELRQLPPTTPRSRLKTADEIGRETWEIFSKGNPGDKSMPGASPQTPWNVRKPTPADDGMSPTAGNDPWPLESGSSWGDSSLSSETPPSTQPRRQQPTTPSSQPPRRPARRNDDDASQTGGMFQDEVESQSKPGGSAWDRLRRGGAPPPQGPPSSWNRQPLAHKEQQEGSTLGDSFTFVESDEERRRERERAQREFDARIEQERQGKDFNEERRW